MLQHRPKSHLFSPQSIQDLNEQFAHQLITKNMLLRFPSNGQIHFSKKLALVYFSKEFPISLLNRNCEQPLGFALSIS